MYHYGRKYVKKGPKTSTLLPETVNTYIVGKTARPVNTNFTGMIPAGDASINLGDTEVSYHHCALEHATYN